MNIINLNPGRLNRFSSLFIVTILLTSLNSIAQEAKSIWEPEPKVITPGQVYAPPSDAIVLLDGSSLDDWVSTRGGAAKWKLEDGGMTVVPKLGSIKTKRSFGDCQLHIEWRTPAIVEGDSQDRGNSGVFLQRYYEVQVLDSYKNKTYTNGQAGSIYGRHVPLVNACRLPGEWQVYDIVFKAPTFKENGEPKDLGYFTVFHNGVLVQNHVEFVGKDVDGGHSKLPILLQDHGSTVGYRNIWIREL